MASPDAIDRPKPAAPPPTATSSWETLFGAPTGPITVYINPVTRQAVQVTSTAQGAELIAQGYIKSSVARENWASFVAGLGSNFKVLDPSSSVADIPLSAAQPLSPEEMAAVQTQQGYVDAQTAANQKNLQTAYGISQAGRDRAALTTKENYKTTEQPTLTSAAAAGAGYHQALGDLFMGRVERDRSLAGLADEQTSAQFQFDLTRQQAEAQRQQQIQQIYNDAFSREQQRRNSGVDSIFKWIAG